jgi:hypothetical protein
MITRRSVFVGISALAVSRLPIAEAAQSPTTADFLFVQSARSMTFDKVTDGLTLHGVSPVTFFFTDRPERIAGNMRTASFIPFWSKGKDSFLSVPPNADLSILEGDKLQEFVVVLRNPVLHHDPLHGDNLTYTIKVLDGTIPERGADVSVFIDLIGMPLTPVSFAGVARRTTRRMYRRAVLY